MTSPHPWLVHHSPPGPARLTLVCVHHAGGNFRVFKDWPGHFPPDIRVLAVSLPGRVQRFAESPLLHVEAIVDALLPSMREVADGPYALFGHSMGAFIAFELARGLRAAGVSLPKHLFVACGRGPGLPNRYPGLHDLPTAEFLAELRRLEGTPLELLDNPEMMDALLPLFRADFGLCDRYVHRPGMPLECPVTVFGGVSDPTVTRAECAGWREHTSAAFTLRMLAGGHFVVHERARAVAGHIARSLST